MARQRPLMFRRSCQSVPIDYSAKAYSCEQEFHTSIMDTSLPYWVDTPSPAHTQVQHGILPEEPTYCQIGAFRYECAQTREEKEAWELLEKQFGSLKRVTADMEVDDVLDMIEEDIEEDKLAREIAMRKAAQRKITEKVTKESTTQKLSYITKLKKWCTAKEFSRYAFLRDEMDKEYMRMVNSARSASVAPVRNRLEGTKSVACYPSNFY